MDGDDKHLYELIDGVLVEKTMGLWESMLASLVVHHIWSYLDIHDLARTRLLHR